MGLVRSPRKYAKEPSDAAAIQPIKKRVARTVIGTSYEVLFLYVNKCNRNLLIKANCPLVVITELFFKRTKKARSQDSSCLDRAI
jgi:hypothetical protein